MLNKSNTGRRDKVPKQKQQVANCAEYDESLRQRGDLAIWISDERACGVVSSNAHDIW
ncbi:hypothetical protein [Sulfitobacter geojensis]|uniref:hypothetical protein n=1 Tax=Sulfitobacter geojensis TaxID=1342299 RepID=UPI000A7A3CE6|nr:hypothetical protein [Sulfitobacter geojensis]